MRKLGQAGSLLIPLIIVIVLFFAAASFGAWAFLGRQDYKDNVDDKIAAAVEANTKAVTEKKDAEFEEKEKEPNKSYTGPGTYGSITFNYPKTWSAYVAEKDNGLVPVDGFFYPNFVPDILGNSAFVLRLKIEATTYDSALKRFDSNVKAGKAKVQAYQFAKVPTITGARVEGLFPDNKHQGTMILVPLRDKVIQIWTENDKFKDDFEKIVLPSVSFNP